MSKPTQKPILLSLTAEDLRALLAVDRALTNLREAVFDGICQCNTHPRLAGVPELRALLRRFEAELRGAHPAYSLLPAPARSSRRQRQGVKL